MPYDENYIANLDEKRRAELARNIRTMSIKELEDLGEKLFPYSDHPWRDAFFNFLRENADATYHHAELNNEFHLIYCSGKDKGIWYVPGTGVGPLQERGRKVMQELIAGAK